MGAVQRFYEPAFAASFFFLFKVKLSLERQGVLFGSVISARLAAAKFGAIYAFFDSETPIKMSLISIRPLYDLLARARDEKEFHRKSMVF